MAHEELVRDIMGTYNLPEKLEDRITKIAIREIKEFSINGFDSVYRHIAQLVERSQLFSRREVSLNQPLSFDSNLTVQDLIGVEDQLENRLDESNPNSPYESISLTPEIRKKLEELVKKYQINGRLIIPRRQIVSTRLNPFSVKFKLRRYNGNPLAFFRKNKNVYGGMTRGELRKVDEGLFISLLRHKQLSKAIPQKRRRYRGYRSPLDYFRVHFKDFNIISRSQLREQDQGLYLTLLRRHQLDRAIPPKQKIEEKIVEYLKQNPGKRPSEIGIGLSLSQPLSIYLSSLIKSGRLTKVKENRRLVRYYVND